MAVSYSFFHHSKVNCLLVKILMLWLLCWLRPLNSLTGAGSPTGEGYHRNICGLMSVCIDLNGGEKRRKENGCKPGRVLLYQTKRGRQRGEKVDHTGHKETPTTRASPFIVHNTSLFTCHTKSDHFLYSNH